MFRRSAATRVLPVAAVVLATIAPLSALHGQVCAGFAALDDTRYRLSVSTANYRYANAHGLSLAAGTRGPVYGAANVAWSYDDELDVSSYDVGIRLGVDLPRGDGRITICPSASLTTSLIPRGQIVYTGIWMETWNVAAAARFGAVATAIQTNRLTIRPGAELEAVRVWGWVRTDYQTDRRNELYWIAGVGISATVADRFTIRPGLTVPFGFVPPRGRPEFYAMPHGRMNREIALELKVGVNFGKRR